MLLVESQLNINLNLGGMDLVPDPLSLLDLNIIESAGTNLPTLEAEVRVQEQSIIQRINENNLLSLTIGTEQVTNNLEDSLWTVQRLALARQGSEFYILHIKALKGSFPQWAKPRVEVSEKMSAVERILTLCERNDRIDKANVSSSMDSQKWIQYGCPDKKHLDDIWMHSKLERGFPLYSNTLQGCRVLDARVLADEEPSWTISFFEETSAGDTLIQVDAVEGLSQMGGFLNSIGGRGLEKQQYSLDDGEDTLLSSDPEAFLALTDKANVSDRFSKVREARRPLSRNVDPDYWRTYLHNYTQLALYSSTKLRVFWEGRYKTIRPLDLVILKDQTVDLDGSTIGVSPDSYLGLYFVSKVARRANRNTLTTMVSLVRDSLNQNLEVS